MDMGPYIVGACLVAPAVTGIIGGAAYRSARRGTALAATSLLGVLAGVGAWVVIGGYGMGGGPASLLFGPVALLGGWASGIALAVIPFTYIDRLHG